MIFRATPQWFVAIDKPFPNGGKTLRELALTAIGETKWYPPRGAEPHRRAWWKDRPDWVLSRQRAWGVPLAIFVEKKTGQGAERSGRVQAHRARPSKPKAPMPGSPRRRRASWATAASRTITSRSPTFWMSGSIPARPMSSRSNSPSIRIGRKAEHADLYLEGSDQHRGWFQSSLLESVRHARPRALRRRADPRLCAGRAGPQNVQVAGQYAGAAGDRGKERRGYFAPVGGVVGFHRRSAHRPGHHQGQCRGLSPPAQHHPLHAGQSGRASTKRSASRPTKMPELERFMLAQAGGTG